MSRGTNFSLPRLSRFGWVRPNRDLAIGRATRTASGLPLGEHGGAPSTPTEDIRLVATTLRPQQFRTLANGVLGLGEAAE